MVRFVMYYLDMINSFLLIIISIIFVTSCAAPIPYRYYQPLNEGEKISPPDIARNTLNAPEYILLFDIHNNVIVRTKLFFDDSTDDDDILQIILIVPKEQTVRLLSDKVEIHSPELSSSVIARVKSIHEWGWGAKIKGKYGLMEAYRMEAPPLDPFEELYGYKIKDPSYYRLDFEFINNNPDTDETPQDVTVFLPDIYINDKLHKIEPLKFESTWTVIYLPIVPQ